MPEPNRISFLAVTRLFSRREILLAALAGSVAIASSRNIAADVKRALTDPGGAKPDSTMTSDDRPNPTPFVPENDYPFFGFEP